MKISYYLLVFSQLWLMACSQTDDIQQIRSVYQISDYQNTTGSARFDQCVFRYAFRNGSKKINLGTLQKQLEVPFDRWAEANGYLTFERVAASAPAEIAIVFADSLPAVTRSYTSFGLIGQPIDVLSKLVRLPDNTCTIYLLDTYNWEPTSLQRVLLFQIGATLGLATSTNPASAMSGQQLNSLTVLDTSDVSAIRRIYNQPCDAWKRLNDPDFGNSITELAFGVQSRGYVLLSPVFSGFALWEYLPATDTWLTRQPFPDTRTDLTIRSRQVFVTNTTAYVGDAYDVFRQTGKGLFWRYQPDLNQWDSIAPLPTLGVNIAHAFGLNNRGYMATFQSDTGNDLLVVWQYDPATNQWTQPTNWQRLNGPASGSDLQYAKTFSLNQQAYLITSVQGMRSLRFDPTQTPAWVPIDSPQLKLSQTVQAAFSHRGYGYCIASLYGGPYNVWRYVPATGWKQIRDFPGEGRITYSFSIGNRAYIGTSTGQFWRYTP